MTERPVAERIQHFTAARRIPTYIGRFHDGFRIPGGPYTLTQFGLFAVVGVVGSMATSTFRGGIDVFSAVLIFACSWGAAWAAGFLPRTVRNPLTVLASALRAMLAPPTGKVAGSAAVARRAGGARSSRASLERASALLTPTVLDLQQAVPTSAPSTASDEDTADRAEPASTESMPASGADLLRALAAAPRR